MRSISASAALVVALAVWVRAVAQASAPWPVPHVVALAMTALVVAVVAVARPRLAAAVGMAVVLTVLLFAGLVVRVFLHRGEPIAWAVVTLAASLSFAAVVACGIAVRRPPQTRRGLLAAVTLVAASMFCTAAALTASLGLPN